MKFGYGRLNSFFSDNVVGVSGLSIGFALTSDNNLHNGSVGEGFRFELEAPSIPGDAVLEGQKTLSTTTGAPTHVQLAAMLNTTLPVGTSVEVEVLSPGGGSISATSTVENAPDGSRHAIFIFPQDAPVDATGVIYYVYDSVGGSTGQFTGGEEYFIGELELWAEYEPPKGWISSFESGFTDPSISAQSMSGRVYDHPGVPYRSAQIAIIPSGEDAVFADFSSVRHTITQGRRVLILPNANGSLETKTAFYGYPTGYTSIKREGQDIYGAGFSFTEVKE